MTITVRPGRPELAAVIIALHAKTVRTVNARHYSQLQIGRWLARQDPERVQRRCAEGAMLVALDGDVVVGFASAVKGELKGLYVAADRQRQGIGSALLAAVEDRLREDGHWQVRSVVTVTARPFYAARGYTEIRELRWPANDIYGLEAWEVVKPLREA